MNIPRLIEAGKKIAKSLVLAKAQFEKGIEDDRLSMYLSEADRDQRAASYVAMMRRRINEVQRDWLPQANVVLGQLAPTPSCHAPVSPKIRYQREHELYAMSPPDRARAFRKAVEESDALTYDVVLTVMRERPWVELLQNIDLHQGRDRWRAKHTKHPSGQFIELSEVINSINAALIELEQAVITVPVG